MTDNAIPENPLPDQQAELTPLPPAHTVNRPLASTAIPGAMPAQTAYGVGYQAYQSYQQSFQPGQGGGANVPAAQPFNWKPVAIGAVIALLLGAIAYQQVRINELSTDVAIISNDMRTSDIPMRLDGIDKKLAQVDNRLSYLDSKITATDQKAQGAIDQYKNSGNPIGNFFNSLGKSLGLNK